MRFSFTTSALTALLAGSSPHSTEALSIHASRKSGSISNVFKSRNSFLPKHDGVSSRQQNHRRDTMLMYEPSDVPPHDDNGRSILNGDSGVWSALANTERWISTTLSQQPAAGGGSNPYVRKEVSYVCETTDEPIMAVANVFRRVREARELGESHSRVEEAVVVDKGPDYVPGTMRQTQVVVIPWCHNFKSFQEFEATFQAINAARRAARDYVTDVSLEKLEMELTENPIERDWVVSISLSSLHPKFGTKTLAESIAEMKKEEQEEDEVDPKLKAYKKQRVLARQSPYPSLVLEVKAMPPPDFDSSSSSVSSPMQEESSSSDSISSDTTAQSEFNETRGPSKQELKKLEALFGKASTDHRSTEGRSEDSFYDSISEVAGIEEVSSEDPIAAAQEWVTQNDSSYDHEKSIFTTTDTKHVDAAYETIFTILASQKHSLLSSSSSSSLVEENTNPQNGNNRVAVGSRSYIIMPNFLSSSATSLEKFSSEVDAILRTIVVEGGSNNEQQQLVSSVSIFHPEHVAKEKRCPVPMLVTQWYVKEE